MDGILDKLDTALELDGSVYRFTTNALEQAPSGTGGDATAANQTTIINHLADIKGGTFSGATDSLEAIRDRGDAAWITATGFSTLDAAGVRSAVGLASANLDTQLSTIDGIVDKLDTAMELDGAVYRFTTNALEQAPSGSGGDATAANQSTIISHLTDIKGGTFSGSTDSLEAIRDRGDSAWVTATGFSTLDAAGIRSAVGLASADLDTQLSAIDTVVDAILADTGTDGVVLSSATLNAAADALLDRTAGVETSYTPRQALRLILAALAGKLSGAATTSIAIRDVNDAKDRITATVDASGNRTAVTLDAS